jgi:hypothetical protein
VIAMEFVFITFCLVCAHWLARLCISRGLSPLGAAQAGFVVTLIPLVALVLYKSTGAEIEGGLLRFGAIFLIFPIGVALKCKLEVEKILKSNQGSKE